MIRKAKPSTSVQGDTSPYASAPLVPSGNSFDLLGLPLRALMVNDEESRQYFENIAEFISTSTAVNAQQMRSDILDYGGELAAIADDVLAQLSDRPELHSLARTWVASPALRQQWSQDHLVIVAAYVQRQTTIEASSTLTADEKAEINQRNFDGANQALGQLHLAYVGFVLHLVTAGGTPEEQTRPQMAALTQIVRDDGLIKVSTSHIARAVFEAIHTAPSGLDWSDYDGQRPPTHTTQLAKGKAGAVYVSLRTPGSKSELSGAEIAALWEKLRQMDQITSDMLIYCLAACVDQPGWVWVSFADFLKVRSIKPIQKPGEPRTWGHGYRTEQIAEAASAIEQLVLLYIEMENVLLPNKRDTLTRNSPALVTREVWTQRQMNGSPVICAIEVQLGTWAEAYREAGAIQFGYLAKKALEYNPRTRQPEKLIAKYLLFHQRNNAKHPVFKRSVLTLLTVADIKIDATRPTRTETRLTQALDRLCGDGVIGGWRWVIDADERRVRKQSLDWAKTMIEIDPPVATHMEYSRFHRMPERKPLDSRKRVAQG